MIAKRLSRRSAKNDHQERDVCVDVLVAVLARKAVEKSKHEGMNELNGKWDFKVGYGSDGWIRGYRGRKGGGEHGYD